MQSIEASFTEDFGFAACADTGSVSAGSHFEKRLIFRRLSQSITVVESCCPKVEGLKIEVST